MTARIAIIPARGGSKRYNAKLLCSYGMNLYGPFFTSTVPHLEFSIQFQSNSRDIYTSKVTLLIQYESIFRITSTS